MNINQVWPEWNEECVLGEGSFGKVYRARRTEYGRTFYSAIKVISVPKNQQEIKYARAQGMNDEELYNYFRGIVDGLLDEITLMDNLKGAKNVVGIEDYRIVEHERELGWDIFIRMELLTPFDSFVSNPGFSQKDVVKLGIDICSALESCEANYIVHRDIKPDNIFISRFGEYKLGDFGIARKLETAQANLSRKGTLNYMAPEVYKSEEYGHNVDIYSLGLVLYTLLNNNRVAFLPPYPQPISYKDNEDALSKRLSGTPLPLPSNANATLGACILKACSYSPRDRYQTATEFKTALIAEWNVLVQSGENNEIQIAPMQFGNDIEKKLQNTTNDMTANGHLVVDEYAQGTTVLDESYEAPVSNGSFDSQKGIQDQSIMDVELPSSYSTAKSNMACKYLAKLIALVLIVLSAIIAVGTYNGIQEFGIYSSRSGCLLLDMMFEDSGFSFLIMGICISLIVLLSSTNKTAVGISVIALSVQVLNHIGLDELKRALRVADFDDILLIVLIALSIIGGVAIIVQKEARLGGTFCLLSAFIVVLTNIRVGLLISSILYIGVANVFVWSYGYKSDAEIGTKNKIFNILAYSVVAFMVFYTIQRVMI